MGANLDNFRQIIKDCWPATISSEQLMMEYIHTYLSNDTQHYIQPSDLSDIIICIYECYEVSGYSISELPKTSALFEDSLLLASETNKKESVNVSYGQLSAQAFKDTKDQLKREKCLKSMAFEDKNNYSLSSHDHDKLYTADISVEYSDFIKDIQAQIARHEKDESELSVLGLLHVDKYKIVKNAGRDIEVKDENASKVYPIYCPKIEFPSPALYAPAVGELKFLPVSKLRALYDNKLMYYGDKQNVNIYADDFDGWVFPNGVTFTCEEDEFSDAMAVFKTSKTTFTVPQLNNFIYAVTDNQKDDFKPLARHLQQVKIGLHSHAMKINKINGSLEILDPEVTKMRFTTSTPPNPYVGSYPIPSDGTGLAVAYFGGSALVDTKSTAWTKGTIEIDPQSQFKLDLQTAPNDQAAGTYQPACQLMPVLMYIGPKHSEFENVS